MRGIFFLQVNNFDATRFNPAYAGNIPYQLGVWLTAQVQPRVCGEYNLKCDNGRVLSGSTPRMRGIFRMLWLQNSSTRFNPAYAGNIIFYATGDLDYEVQPRVCGEYSSVQLMPSRFAGSTPRMRGISCFCPMPSTARRFNPAYAGNILKRS